MIPANLTALSRKELQSLAKTNGVRANQKSDMIIIELEKIRESQTTAATTTTTGGELPVLLDESDAALGSDEPVQAEMDADLFAAINSADFDVCRKSIERPQNTPQKASMDFEMVCTVTPKDDCATLQELDTPVATPKTSSSAVVTKADKLSVLAELEKRLGHPSTIRTTVVEPNDGKVGTVNKAQAVPVQRPSGAVRAGPPAKNWEKIHKRHALPGRSILDDERRRAERREKLAAAKTAQSSTRIPRLPMSRGAASTTVGKSVLAQSQSVQSPRKRQEEYMSELRKRLTGAAEKKRVENRSASLNKHRDLSATTSKQTPLSTAPEKKTPLSSALVKRPLGSAVKKTVISGSKTTGSTRKQTGHTTTPVHMNTSVKSAFARPSRSTPTASASPTLRIRRPITPVAPLSMSARRTGLLPKGLIPL